MLSIDLKNKRAVVTGVSSGIGSAIARILAQAGCDVAGCGHRPADTDGARTFVQSVEAEGRKAWYFSVDLSQRSESARFIRESRKALGGIDFLVSNAGRNVFEGARDCSEDAWETCMELDLAAHWRLARAARDDLVKAQPGVILIMGSNHGWSTIPGCFPYNVAKAGLLGMVQSLAIEWGPQIRTVGIAPGFIETEGGQTWFNSFPDPAAERARTDASHPVGRIGTVDEIGQLCAFLASPMAGFISGTTLCVDGGRSALMQDG